jgi:hypothetical protein
MYKQTITWLRHAHSFGHSFFSARTLVTAIAAIAVIAVVTTTTAMTMPITYNVHGLIDGYTHTHKHIHLRTIHTHAPCPRPLT